MFARIVTIVLASISLLFSTGIGFTRIPMVNHSPLQSVFDQQNHITVIILDMSGSMRQNDSSGIRCSAANAYIDLSGPGDQIGVINLDNSTNDTNAAHGFDSASIIAQPTDMSTQSSRNNLRQLISSKTNSCSPDGNTPTYSAMSDAFNMLTSATQAGASGSAILLTDGVPEPNPGAQISAIQSELLPQFKAHNWPIDVIGLGSQAPQDNVDFHSFLAGIASYTNGTFNDDTHGIINNPNGNPLNIAPFFVNIFSLRNGRTLGPTIDPTPLNGGTVSRDVPIGQYESHLDIITVKDTPDASITLTAPNGTTLPPQVSGTLVTTDPHYAIFSIENPQPGTWTVTASGSGQFLMDSLTVSTLALAITSPQKDGIDLPIGVPITASATISFNGTVVTGGRFDIKGILSYAGDAGTPYSQSIILSDSNTPGIYQAQVTVPISAPTGTYTISVAASQVSGFAISSQTRTVNFDLFPTPYFLTKPNGVPTTGAAATTVIKWDRALQFLYTLPIVKNLAGLPLNDIPAQPETVLPGEVISPKDNKPYCNATVNGTAQKTGTAKTSTVSIAIVNSGCGTFTVQFPALEGGTYAVNFETSGTYSESHGAFTPTTRIAMITVQNATFTQELRAWLVTLGFYLFLIPFLTFLLIRYFFLPEPRGAYEVSGGGSGSYGSTGKQQNPFSRSRAPWQILWKRYYLPKPLRNIKGVEILATRDGYNSGMYPVRQKIGSKIQWKTHEGKELSTTTYKPARGLQYTAPSSYGDSRETTIMFVAHSLGNKKISTNSSKTTSHSKGGNTQRKPATVANGRTQRKQSAPKPY